MVSGVLISLAGELNSVAGVTDIRFNIHPTNEPLALGHYCDGILL